MRRKRHDLRLLQKEVAVQIGVDVCTVTNWELNHTVPETQYLPKIIEFLGFMPFSIGASFPERLKSYRMCRGLSQRALALQFGVDEGTLCKWESGRSQPSKKLRERVEQAISATQRILVH